jgi:hypothetical protein
MYRRLYPQKTDSFLPGNSFVPEGERFNKRMTKNATRRETAAGVEAVDSQWLSEVFLESGPALPTCRRKPDHKPQSLAARSQTRSPAPCLY